MQPATNVGIVEYTVTDVILLARNNKYWLTIALGKQRIRENRRGVLSSEALQERKYISTRPIVYAAASQITDSNIYYASTGMHTTEIELPPHLVGVQHLPHENIHVTLPHLRPVSRSSLAIAMRAEQLDVEHLEMRSNHLTFTASPTPSQVLYSFDDEPIYDMPPDDDTLYE
ncbi:hypothetical protein Tcan_10280 [Toxocara canis]|uniref:Uncharacterized protein n=1 Tax=Toxocara canis TaxID=6265 RepID=A0A0B2UP65_TOXCA|nr:hypothetical protein Tcan_10280 [Toxocara canis]